MFRNLISFTICSGVLASGFAEDIIPVQSRMENNVTIVDDTGKTVEKRQTIEDYIRNSEGSFYQKKREIDPISGQVVHVWIYVCNMTEGVEYQIDPEKKQVSVGRRKPRKPVFTNFAAEVERTNYLGRRAVIYPIISGNFGKVGEMWLDEESHLILYLEQKTKVQGYTRLKTIRTTEFVTGIEPDPALFQIPQGYATVEPFR
jgi:hypothetical protein